MSQGSIREYAAALRPRYQAASKEGKGRLLDEFCAVTGYHRKAAVRLLSRAAPKEGRRCGRPRQYGTVVAAALREVWEAADRICSKRLTPYLPELVAVLERHGELDWQAGVREQVLRLSGATMDRLLRPFRVSGGRRPYTQSAAATALKALVPVRTFGEWAGVRPGAFQGDLVAHCGETTAGFYLNSLVLVDVATSWSAFEILWGKGQSRVAAGVHRSRQRLPLRMRELHNDNGGEFLNHVLYPYCQREGIALTRGRPYQKNDQAYVEQKNGAVVRRQVGYDRYSSKAAYTQFQRLYGLLEPYHNFFQPVQKLVSTQRQGAKVRKCYDQARTPYQRLLESGELDAPTQAALEQQYRRLNPVRLRAQIQEALDALWKLAERPGTVTAGARIA